MTGFLVLPKMDYICVPLQQLRVNSGSKGARRDIQLSDLKKNKICYVQN